MIDAYCNDEATLIVSGGYDTGGRPKATTEEAIQTKYFDKQKLIRTTNGEQVVATGYFLVSEEVTITNEDKIEFDSVKYIIMAIEKAKDFSQSHYKVWVQ